MLDKQVCVGTCVSNFEYCGCVGEQGGFEVADPWVCGFITGKEAVAVCGPYAEGFLCDLLDESVKSVVFLFGVLRGHGQHYSSNGGTLEFGGLFSFPGCRVYDIHWRSNWVQ